jgi:hypothetical protein
MSFLISSLVLCFGCASVQRPNSFIWGVNGSASRLEGYNIKTDYDENGVRRPGAKPVLRSLNGLRDLNGALLILPAKTNDPLKDEGTRGVKRWFQDMRDYSKEHCQ